MNKIDKPRVVIEKLDIHCHTTKRKIRNIVPKDATIRTIQEEARKYNINKIVLLATYFSHRGTGVSNFRLLDWIQEHEFNGGYSTYLKRDNLLLFGSLDFEHFFNQGYSELEEMAERNLLDGIKIYTSYQHIDLGSDNFRQAIELARQHKLPLMFHVGYTHTGIQKNHFVAGEVKPKDLEFIAQDGQVVIISHLAKPFTDELIEVVKRNPTIYSDMSGLIDSYHEKHEISEAIDLIKRFLGECGPQRLLFGTDFPVQTHEDSILMIRQAMQGYSNQDKKEVYYFNAYGILNGLQESERRKEIYRNYDPDDDYEYRDCWD